MIIQLIAYRGTGKDTLYNNITDPEHLGWKVYGPPQSKTLKIATAYRVAYADKLKFIVCDLLKLDKVENPSSVHPLIKPTQVMTSKEWVTGGHLDLLKDVSPEEINLSTLENKSVRRWLIDHGTYLKSIHGLNYFRDLIADEVSQIYDTVIITDTRYLYEMFPDTISVRLFRSDVPIPDISEHSERSLDTYQCSYVFCKSDGDFRILAESQPQYKEYVYLGPFTK